MKRATRILSAVVAVAMFIGMQGSPSTSSVAVAQLPEYVETDFDMDFHLDHVSQSMTVAVTHGEPFGLAIVAAEVNRPQSGGRVESETYVVFLSLDGNGEGVLERPLVGSRDGRDCWATIRAYQFDRTMETIVHSKSVWTFAKRYLVDAPTEIKLADPSAYRQLEWIVDDYNSLPFRGHRPPWLLKDPTATNAFVPSDANSSTTAPPISGAGTWFSTTAMYASGPAGVFTAN